MTGVYEYDRRSECIQREGVLKGLLWCETDYKSNEERSFGVIALFIKGLGWPLNLISSSESTSEPESADERLKKLVSIFKECGYDPKSVNTNAKECVIRRTNQFAGKNTYKEAYCQRHSSSYEHFAEARDSGITLNASLQALNEAMPDILQKLSEVSGERINEKQLIEDAKQVMKYVYAHPDKTPSLLSYEQYYGCINQ